MTDSSTELRSTSPWWTVKQAAEYLGFSIDYIRDGCRDGKLRHVRLSNGPRGEIRIRREWLDSWCEKNVEGGS